MTKEMPLKVKMENAIDGKTVEFSAGKTDYELERVGYLRTYDGYNFATYVAYGTQLINSFYITLDDLGRKLAKKIQSGEELILKRGDSIGWGYDIPSVQIHCDEEI